MHRVVQIPELLALIFISLPSPAKVNAACVCTTWSAIALDALWREVDDFRRLVELLAPVKDDPVDLSYVSVIIIYIYVLSRIQPPVIHKTSRTSRLGSVHPLRPPRPMPPHPRPPQLAPPQFECL
jgi:hypothetical protein